MRFEGKIADEAIAAALADPECLMVNRNAGSGTRVLMDQKLNGARPPGYANQPKSHNAVAAAIAQGRADWGFAIEPVARMYDLSFLPVAPEEYDFLVVENWRDRPGVRAFLAALRDQATRAASRLSACVRPNSGRSVFAIRSRHHIYRRRFVVGTPPCVSSASQAGAARARPPS